MTDSSVGGRIPPPKNTPPGAHKHNLTDVVGFPVGILPGGTVPVFDGTDWVPSTSLVPGLPVAPTVTSAPYNADEYDTTSTPRGTAVSSVKAVVTPPSTYTDGSVLVAPSLYSVRWRYEDPSIYGTKNIQSITVSAGVVTLTTTAAHGMTGGNFVVVTGSTAANNFSFKLLTASGSTMTFNNDLGVAAGAVGTVMRVSDWTTASSVSPTVSFLGVKSGTYLSVQAKVTDGYGNSSSWSTTTTHLTAADSVAPGQPSAPVIVPKLGTLQVSWDGKLNAGGAQPSDYAYTDVFVASSSGTYSASTYAARYSGAFQFLVTKDPVTGSPLVQGSTYYVQFVSYDNTGNASAASTIVSSVPTALKDNEIADLSVLKLTSGVLTADQIISGGSITTNAGTVSNAITSIAASGGIATVTVDGDHGLTVAQQVVIAGSSTANNSTWTVNTVPSARVFTVSSGVMVTAGAAGTAQGIGSRVQMTAAGLSGFTGALETFRLTSGGIFTIQSAATGSRIVLDSNGLRVFNGAATVVDLNASGTATFSGTVNAATFTGNIIVGNTIKSVSGVNGTANVAGLIMDSNGIRAYKAATATPFLPIQTFSIDTSGAATFSGTVSSSAITSATISSSTISSSTITGGIIRTAASGSRVVMDDQVGSGQISLYTGTSGEISGLIQSAFLSLTGTAVISTQLVSPTTGSISTSTSITLYGRGTGSSSTTLVPYGSTPHIEIQPTDTFSTQLILGNWARANTPSAAGGTTTVSLSTGYSGLMDWDGYYIMMQPSTGTRNTYIGAGPGGFVSIRPNGNAYGITVDTSNDLVPDVDNVSNLGTSTKRWVNISAAGSITAGGTFIAGGGVVRPDANTGLYLRGNQSNTSNQIVVNATTFSYNICSVDWVPSVNAGWSIGNTSFRWNTIFATNGTISTSDSRVKTDIVTIDDTNPLGIGFIRSLVPVKYRFSDAGKMQARNADGSLTFDADGERVMVTKTGVRTHTGFIAQQVKESLDAISTDWGGWSMGDVDDPDSIQSLRYEEFIAPLVASVQNLDARLTALETA